MGKRRDNGTLKKVALVLAAVIVLFVIYYLTGIKTISDSTCYLKAC